MNEAHVGMRLPAGGLAMLDETCRSGTSHVPSAASDATRSISTVACVLSDGEACGNDTVSFIDAIMPRYHLLAYDQAPPAEWKHPTRDKEVGHTLDRSKSQGPRLSMVRLGDLGTVSSCSEIREASSPARD